MSTDVSVSYWFSIESNWLQQFLGLNLFKYFCILWFVYSRFLSALVIQFNYVSFIADEYSMLISRLLLNGIALQAALC